MKSWPITNAIVSPVTSAAASVRRMSQLRRRGRAFGARFRAADSRLGSATTQSAQDRRGLLERIGRQRRSDAIGGTIDRVRRLAHAGVSAAVRFRAEQRDLLSSEPSP